MEEKINGKQLENNKNIEPMDTDFSDMITGWEKIENRLKEIDELPFSKKGIPLKWLRAHYIEFISSILITIMLLLWTKVLLPDQLQSLVYYFIVGGLIVTGWAIIIHSNKDALSWP